MGRTSKWIKNFFTGKKEEKIKDNKDGEDGGGAATSLPSTTTAIFASPPLQKRRCSFRRSNNTEKVVNHKSCRSFDSIMSSQLVSQALFEYAIQQQNHTTTFMVPPIRATTKTTFTVSHMVASAAATKIQAFFRSYLARTALRALRGLVKLQAVVRGHLVRKQTTTMVRCMKALVAIQVRARFQRIQLAEDTESTKRGSVMAHESRPTALQLDRNEKIGHLGSKMSARISNHQSSGQFSIDLLHKKSMIVHNKLVNEGSIAPQISTRHDEPNYMTRTKSSRAKTRSHSEPRQRPTKQKRESRRTSSNESLNAIIKGNHTRYHQNNQEGWVTQLHRSSKSIKDFEFDSASTCTNGSSYCTTLYAYEPAANLY